MSTLLKPLSVREKLLKQGIKIFTPQIFLRIFNTSRTATKYFLEKQAKAGFLIRLKKGFYVIKTDPPSEEEIANALYRPSYISFEYALSYWGVLPEMPYIVTSATTKPTRFFTTRIGSFSYRTIKGQAYTGYSLVKSGDRSFLMADLEKALVDYLYFVTLHKSPFNERLVTASKGRVDLKKLRHYGTLYQSQLLQTLLETIK